MTTPVHDAAGPGHGHAPHGTRVLTRRDVQRVLTMRACIDAVADAFRRHAQGDSIAPELLGTHVDGGGFHVKTAGFSAFGHAAAPVYAAKVNANFPGNPAKHGLPTIQGVIALFNAANGRLLALLDSMHITSLRTAAATAVAATHLARADANLVTICGCGEQGRSQLRALCAVRPLRRAFAFDVDPERARVFAREMSAELYLDVRMVAALDEHTQASDIWVTCTTARHWFLGREHVSPGAFIAAVGADNPDKQEIEPELMAASTVVVDLLDQCAVIGDLHHALDHGVMRRDDVASELADVVAGRIPGRSTVEQVIVFDSTGTALQDVAVAALVYERSVAADLGLVVDLGGGP